MRVVVQICVALFVLLFVALVILYVVLPRVAGGDVVRVRPSEAARTSMDTSEPGSAIDSAWQTGGPNRAAACGKAHLSLTNTQMGGITLKDEAPEDDVSACEGSSRLYSMCG